MCVITISFNMLVLTTSYIITIIFATLIDIQKAFNIQQISHYSTIYTLLYIVSPLKNILSKVSGKDAIMRQQLLTEEGNDFTKSDINMEEHSLIWKDKRYLDVTMIVLRFFVIH